MAWVFTFPGATYMRRWVSRRWWRASTCSPGGNGPKRRRAGGIPEEDAGTPSPVSDAVQDDDCRPGGQRFQRHLERSAFAELHREILAHPAREFAERRGIPVHG